MRLAAAAGLYDAMPDEMPQEAADRLVAEAADFLRAGGVLSLSDWCEASVAERVAFVRAGQIVSTERAVAVGMATQGPAGLAEAVRPVDGGDAARSLSLAGVLGAVAERLQAEGSIPSDGAP